VEGKEDVGVYFAKNEIWTESDKQDSPLATSANTMLYSH
jgi:hypothetical protein